MKVRVYATSEQLQDKDIKDKLVVVIDVLRATSVMITALNNGCKEIIPVTDIEEAVKMARNYDKDSHLLCGERNIVGIEGFDLSNSPLEFTREVVEGKTLLMTTTNGTKTIHRAKEGKEVIIASLLNAFSAAEYIINRGMDVAFVCAGTNGNFSIDDIVTVGAIISYLFNNKNNVDIKLSDLAFVCYDLYEYHKTDLRKLLENCIHYNKMIELGLSDDIDYCLQMNAIPIVGIYKDGIITTVDK